MLLSGDQPMITQPIPFKMKQFFFAFLLCALACKAIAQDTEVYTIRTNDGSVFVGQIVQRTDTHLVVFVKSIGSVQILYRDIDSMVRGTAATTMTPGAPGTRYAPADTARFEHSPHKGYFLGPSGYGVRKRKHFYQNSMIVGNMFHFGVTDQFALNVGAMFTGHVWVSPQFSIPVIPEKLQLGVGSVHGFILDWGNSGFGIFYGQATVGSRDNHFTIGMGSGYLDSEWQQLPAYILSGQIRPFRRAAFISENYITADMAIYSAGVRQVIRRVNLDYAVVVIKDILFDELFGFPYVSISVPLYKEKR